MAVNTKRRAELGEFQSAKKAKLDRDRAPQTKAPRSDDPVKTADKSWQAKRTPNRVSQNNHSGKPEGLSSRDAHHKQKQVALERKSQSRNYDEIVRTKKIWERLRIKSAVPKDERETLVQELFSIITGRVKEFVFKHDSVRVIQTALKYATPSQKTQIAQELRGSYRELAESKYAKFLVAKLVMIGDDVRDWVVPEFYGHVKRLMRHPEASWIVDDIYRGLATKSQKARLLREWYGPEFVLEAQAYSATPQPDAVTADVKHILTTSPEKRGPLMQHLREMTNQLVQKKTTGFTMLHDALLQYFVNTKPGSAEATDFLDLLKDDEEGDLFKNLAFTESGAQLVCLALAYGSSKDRRTILKFFKTHIKLLSGDTYGHRVLLTAYEVIDDTVMTAKAIFPELLSKDLGDEERSAELMGQALHLTARVPLLYLMSPDPPRWLVSPEDVAFLHDIKTIRSDTSKKDPETRRVELVKAMSQSLLDLVAAQAASLAETSFGCQFVVEVLTGAIGDKQPALTAVARLATPETEHGHELVVTPHAGRMFKTLVQGGRYHPASHRVQLADPPLNFHNTLYDTLMHDEGAIMAWATGPNAFTIVAMLEAVGFGHAAQLEALLKQHQAQLESIESTDKAAVAGVKVILDKLKGAALPVRSSRAPSTSSPTSKQPKSQVIAR